MNKAIQNILRFLLFFLMQTLVFNQVEVGFGIHIMVYPLFILMLSTEMNVFALLTLSFFMGLMIDSLSNTFGLHASSAVLIAYFRPQIFKLFAPRDGYDPLIETNFFTMGFSWYLKTFGLILFVHHLWFFSLELFRLDEIFSILRKTFLSVPISFGITLVLHFMFFKKYKKNES